MNKNDSKNMSDYREFGFQNNLKTRNILVVNFSDLHATNDLIARPNEIQTDLRSAI